MGLMYLQDRFSMLARSALPLKRGEKCVPVAWNLPADDGDHSIQTDLIAASSAPV